MRHIISVLLENEAGALSRVAGLFSARGYNIESLTVAPTEDSTLSRMTLVTTGDEAIIEQITKQLNKLIDVVKLVDLSEGKHIERELMMIKVRADHSMREELKRLADDRFEAPSPLQRSNPDLGSMTYHGIRMIAEGRSRFAVRPFESAQGKLLLEVYPGGLIKQLGLSGGEKVLEVGTGSGYQAAVLAELGCEVYSI